MQIPIGEFGNRVAQIRQTNISNVGGGQSQATDNVMGAVSAALTTIATNMQANNKLDAENELFQYQVGLDDINNQVTELYRTGKINYQQMPEERQKLIDNLPSPSFENLDKLEKKSFLLQKDKLLHANKLSMIKQYGLAMQNTAQSSVDERVANVTESVQQPNANLEDAKSSLFNSESFQQTGEFGFQDGWQPKVNEIYRRLESTFVQSQMKHASEAGNIEALQSIRTSLVDEEQFTALTPLVKKQFTKQVDALIDITTGKNYGKTLVNNVNQLVEKTGDFSAVRVFNNLSAMYKQALEKEGQSATTIDQAKNIASVLGESFDEQRFNNDPQYTEQLQQNYFNKLLDNYGSPLMAAAAIQAGPEQLNKWLTEFGDPAKDELSDTDFIAKIPDYSIKQKLGRINQQLNNSSPDELDISASLAAIDNDSNLNNNQKRYAKAEFRQYMESVQQQLQTAYRENHQLVWRDIYINKIPLSEIDPARITQLTASDQVVLLDTPKKTLDVVVYSEAKGRLKAGDNFNVLKEYGNKLPVNQLDELLNLQQDLTINPEKRNALLTTTSMIADRSKLLGITDSRILNQLNDNITSELADLETNRGRKVTQQEMQDISDRYILKAKLDQQTNWYKPQQQIINENAVIKIEQIPVNVKQKISKVLEQNDLEVTDENIIQAYGRLNNDDTN
ncbi:hypothetical protein [Entomomonas asaccharolytica]|uniref:Uncharacterized protein n=1 Tax=Entomomonas asaccharolytica TaxID=2785331 RepID=A0A974NDP3_9GAMM|nr:hypothetical protein [Entomomonas asaccharolytica]QQP84700.1 hypothetical protein JHT90_09795 [Entomomonas asaccharolytica]